MSERMDNVFERACAELLKGHNGGWVKSGYVAREKAIDVDQDERTVSAVISDESVDRDNEVVLLKGLKLTDYRMNPVVLFMHDHRSLIGKSLWQKIQPRAHGPKAMIAKTQFAETDLAQEIFALVSGDFMRGVSIGMDPFTIERRMPTSKECRDRKDLTDARMLAKSDLVEYSFATVPANANALTTAVGRKMLNITMPFYEPLVRAVGDATPRKVVVRSVQKPVETVVRRVQTVKRAIVQVTDVDIRRGVAKELAHRAGRD